MVVFVSLGVLLSVSLSSVDELAGGEVLYWVVNEEEVALGVLLSVSTSNVAALAGIDV